MATLEGDWTDNSLTGSDEPDQIEGHEGHNTIDGGGGGDSIDGGSGDDTISGGAGNDCILGGAGEDVVYAGPGDDSIDGGSQDDTIFGDDGNDVLLGGSGDDQLFGGAGDDSIDSTYDNATIFGGVGNDTIRTQYGTAYVDGGAGDDQIWLDGYSGGAKYVAFGKGAGSDYVHDFNPEIDFVHIGDLSPDAIVITPTEDSRIWTLSLAGGDPDDKMVLDWSFSWNDAVTEDQIRARLVGSDTYAPPADLSLPCFAAGSRIATPDGPRRIERLRPGDLVETRDNGPRPVKSLLRSRVAPREMVANAALCPVRIAAGALGPGQPDRAMLLSRQHGVLMQAPDGHEVMVRARHLAEELGLARLQPARRSNPLLYLHLFLGTHELVCVDGVWSETLFIGPELRRSAGPLRRLFGAKPLPATARRVRPLLTRAQIRAAAGPLRPPENRTPPV
ncbi:Hint domain-containing protein [Rhodovulum kholense]|uniref:Hemolysin type calcium-binding protein n=1 Tax=Rhodovulum kholense TaxID=453584 RepID=A0A8E2VGH0_9RHOB|nr:Hint domain-containing protein [Rhodovulum kholense]PTW41665.1 hemolysin type calcium-binding protein [Rhodovulum kholense]